MSVAAMTAVWRYSQAPDMSSLLILLALADWADDDGYCFPSRRAICQKTGASASTTKRAMREHLTRGEVERVRVRGHVARNPREFVGRTGFRPTNLYRLTLVDQLGSTRPQFLERNRARTAPVPDAEGGSATDQHWGHADPVTGATLTGLLGPRATALSKSLIPSEDTSVDTSEELSAVAPPRPSHPEDENPNENLGVITKIAHEVLDLYAHTPDVTEAEIIEAVKRHCATLAIAYRSDVVCQALDSALFQRRRVRKPPFFPGTPGDTAWKALSCE